MTEEELTNHNRDSEIDSKPSWRWVWIAGFAILGLWITLGWVVPGCIVGGDLTGAGTFGDSFGMVNALFSGLAFLGVIVAIWLQNREFQNQLREFSQQTRLQSQQLEQEREASEAQRLITEQQIKLLQEERDQRERDKELSTKPIFMLRVVHADKQHFASLRLHNGGAPVFDLRIESGQHRVQFENECGERSPLAETIARDHPISLYVESDGFSGPLSAGSFSIRYLKIDHSEEVVRLRWKMPGGFNKERTPHTEIGNEED